MPDSGTAETQPLPPVPGVIATCLKEKKRKDYAFRRQLMRSQVLYQAAQEVVQKQ